MPIFIGNNGSDELYGTFSRDTLTGLEGDDFLVGFDGDDLMQGGGGRDFLDGGDDDDTLDGGGGSDILLGGAGDDSIVGDSGNAQTGNQTTSAQGVIASTQQSLAISLTLPDASNDASVTATGLVSNSAVTGGAVNVAIVVDVSGSTTNTVAGLTVGDQNGNGSFNEIIDAEIAAVEALVNSIVNDASQPGANVALIPFASSATTTSIALANADANSNNVFDTIDAARTLVGSGGTSFSAGLQNAVNFFNGQPAGGSNYVFFLSDGFDGSSGFSAQVAALTDPNGINATIQAFGVGSNSSEAQLDLVDDNIDNNSATIVTDLNQLSAALVTGGIDPASIDRVEILVNGVLAATLPAASLSPTPFGLEFNTVLNGLSPTAADTVLARVIATDVNATTVTTQQVIEIGGNPPGDDVIYAGSGDDMVLAGGGDDSAYGGSGEDSIHGGAGDDLIWGNGDDDSLSGGAGADDIMGGSGTDTVEGGDGNDMLYGGLGSDLLSGDLGNDVLSGGDGNDLLLGGGGNDVLNGQGQKDTIEGGAGDDIINGANGGDSLMGGEGDDRINAGRGADFVDGGNGGDTVLGLSENDTILGGNGQDSLDGGNGQDSINGGQGADTLLGDLGDDVLNGGDSNDLLMGGEGNDTLRGQDQSDTIDGGAGDDEMFGGTGGDTFVFTNGFGNDTIFGFEGFNTEKIDLSAVSAIVDFDDLVANHLANVGGDAMIVRGVNTILLDGVAFGDVGVGLAYSAGDFIF